jgi:hypothetical protein
MDTRQHLGKYETKPKRHAIILWFKKEFPPRPKTFFLQASDFRMFQSRDCRCPRVTVPLLPRAQAMTMPIIIIVDDDLGRVMAAFGLATEAWGWFSRTWRLPKPGAVRGPMWRSSERSRSGWDGEFESRGESNENLTSSIRCKTRAQDATSAGTQRCRRPSHPRFRSLFPDTRPP